MIVTLNGQRIEVTLERERTLGEFLSGIEGWLEKSSHSLSGFAVDGVEIPPESVEEACARELEEVERVDLRALSWRNLLTDALSICGEALAETLRERESARKEGRRPETAAFAERFQESPARSFLGLVMADLPPVVENALRAEGTDPEADLRSAAAIVEERGREARSPREELRSLVGGFDPMVRRLEEIPLHLQTGKDALAAATLGDFSVLCAKLLRLVPALRNEGIDVEERLVGDTPFPSFVEELSTALKELTTAFEVGDAVLVGDLAEYEVAPRIRTLATALGTTLSDAPEA